MSFEEPGDGRLCDHCNRPGVPYEYQGETFSGLTAYLGDRLCARCRDIALDREAREATENAPITIYAYRQ